MRRHYPDKLREHELPDVLIEIRDLADTLLATTPTLFSQAKRERREGYPTSTIADGAATARSGVSDPTMAAALATTPALDHLDAMTKLVVRARQVLREADSHRHAATPKDEAPEEQPLAMGCVNCAVYGIYALATEGGRCPACARYRKRHNGADAPETVVLAREYHPARRRTG